MLFNFADDHLLLMIYFQNIVSVRYVLNCLHKPHLDDRFLFFIDVYAPELDKNGGVEQKLSHKPCFHIRLLPCQNPYAF